LSMTDIPNFDFAKAIAEIEEINRWFQSEDINLDEGLAKFRRGLLLIKQCKERLKKAETEFVEIKKEFDTSDEAAVKSSVTPGESPKVEKTADNIPF